MHWVLQGKLLVKNLDFQVPELSYSLSLDEMGLHKEPPHDISIVNHLKTQAVRITQLVN